MEDEKKRGMQGVGCEEGSRDRVVGVFVVSANNELLLQQHDAMPSNPPRAFVWGIPRLSFDGAVSSSLQAVQAYVAQLGMEGEVYEAFIVQPNHQPLLGGSIAIVLVTPQSAMVTSDEAYRWVPLDVLMFDVHEQPALYAGWFRSSFESVVLYLKNLLKNRSFRDKVPMHLQNV
jgi:hypothetical protein